MPFSNYLCNLKSQLQLLRLRRNHRPTAWSSTLTNKFRLERLEERKVLSGFGVADGAYVVEPWSGSYSDIKIQPTDQKIVASGQLNITKADGTAENRMVIARYDSLGNVDSNYGSGGVSAPTLGTSNESGNALVIQSDGKAVVAGHNSANRSFAIARFNASGTLDSGFGNGGWNSLDAREDGFNPATSVGLQSTGKIVVAGVSMDNIPILSTLGEVGRLTAGGAVDSGKGGFGETVNGKPAGYTLTQFGMPKNGLNALAVQPDDKMVTVGFSYTDGNSRRLIVARYTSSGTLDKAFNGVGYSAFLSAGIGDSYGSAVALQSNGKIVVAGFCTGTDGANDMLVARYNPNGTLDTSFGGGSGYVRLDDATTMQSEEGGAAVVIQPDGKIVVGGQTTVSGFPSKVLVARFNVDGTPDITFATGGFKIGAPLPNTGYHSFATGGVALQSDGSIIVTGGDDWDSTNAYAPHPLLMRFYGSTPSPIMAFSSAAISYDRNKPDEVKREDPMAEVMYELEHGQLAADLAENRIAIQYAAIVPDRAPTFDLLYGNHSDPVDDSELLVQLGDQLNFAS